MSLNIDEEHIKFIQIVDDKTFSFLKFAKENKIKCRHQRINFLWLVLNSTIKYPQVELYLKNLLNYFTVDELEFDYGSILHHMANYSFMISLNAFEIMLNYGINVNIKSPHGSTAAHVLFSNYCDEHVHNILKLLIKYNIDLNIINSSMYTVLDVLSREPRLNQEIKNCIMLSVDFGATTNYSRDNEVYDFIQYYTSSTIKPAIKMKI